MTPYELFTLIKEKHCYDNIEYTIEETNDLLEQIHNNPMRFASDLEKELEEESVNSGRCYLCGSDLEFIEHNEPMEYMGSPCSEKIIEAQCSNRNCSYTI